MLDRAVRNWSTMWANPVGDTFLPLLADTLDTPIHVFQPVSAGGPQGIVLRYGPTTNTRALEVHYTGLNHYSASDAHSPAITPSNAPRGPEDANSLLPDGRYRPAPIRDAGDEGPASQVLEPAPKDSWFGLRAHARPAVHSTERFDPHADQSNPPRPGVLSGATTLVRTSIRRIQAPNGTWVRDYTLNLPVTTTDPERAAQLQQRLTRLLDTHLNSGLELPGSRDQLHVTLNLIDDPTHPEAITLTDTADPARADQLHLDLGHSDADLLHEALHYLGLPDEQRDNDFLLRNHPNSTSVHTTGLMADTAQGPVHIPRRYLRTIENVTAAGPQLHNHTGQLTDGPTQDPDTTPIPADTTPTTARHDQTVAARDAAQEELDTLELGITDALAEQARQAARQRHAERDLGDVVAVLEARRAAAGDGTALLTTGSLSATPAAWPRRTPRPTPARIGAAPMARLTEEPQNEPENDPQNEPGVEPEEEPEEGRHRPAVSREQGPESFARSLAQLLATPAPGTTASDTTPTWPRTSATRTPPSSPGPRPT
ncbi:hypothetical protein ACRAWF_43470 [Streptomyces sp. L7]